MLYSVSKQDPITALPPVPGLRFEASSDEDLLAAIGNITHEQVQERLANHNLAYVAFLLGTPVAFGWLALENGRIGELNHEFVLPRQHAYLWNFRTLPEYKGKGIYPLLLQYIITNTREVKHFWILHAPENLASKRGIEKAGFIFRANVSFLDIENVIYKAEEQLEPELIHQTFGFTPVTGELATCWNCSSPYIKNKTECCCTIKGSDCSGNKVSQNRN